MSDQEDISYDGNAVKSAIIISNRPDIAANISEDLSIAGGRTIGPYSVQDVLADPDICHGTQAVIMDIDSDDAATMRVLHDIAARNTAREREMTIITELPFLDAIYGALSQTTAHIIIGQNQAERIVTFATMLLSVPQAGRAPSHNNRDNELQRITHQVTVIAKRLAELSNVSETGSSDSFARENESGYREEGEGSGKGLMDETDAAEESMLQNVRDILRARRLRERFFDAGLFADPAWDMLLDMMAAHLDNSRVSVSSLCIAAYVPPTTALRWIKVMTEQGIFERRADSEDGRRVFVALSDNAYRAMQDYLRTLQKQKLITV